jgi:hypothetical protein
MIYTYVQIAALVEAARSVLACTDANQSPADALETMREALDPFGGAPALCPGPCSLSYGEGTREDPDRCVNCGALFERDAATPFAPSERA